ncbi:hypothetical protein P7C70_g1700, partial [Phenoliferia sp. Uapishka_3]
MPGPSFAASRLVNPINCASILTLDQLWKGLSKKERNPELFIPSITSCEVLSDEGNKLSRDVHFGDKCMREELEWHDSTIVYFEMANGTRITNVVSFNEMNELVLTFSFAGGLPPAGFDADGKAFGAEKLNAIFGGGIDSTLRVIREMVKDGRVF